MPTNFEIIKAHYAGSDSKDLAAMLAPLTAETRWTEMAGFPCAGTYIGPEAVVEHVFMALGAAWDGYTLKLERLLQKPCADATRSRLGTDLRPKGRNQ